jgi:kinetochore protein NNF1
VSYFLSFPCAHELTRCHHRPHALPAQQLYLSHLAPSLSQQSQHLQQRQETLQAENAEILQRVLQQRKEIESIMKGLENVVVDLDQSAAALKPEDIEELVDEAREVDEDLRVQA